MAIKTKDLIDLEFLTADEIREILDTAKPMKAVMQRDIKTVPALRGKTVATLFYENSTSSFRKELVQGVNSVSIMVGAEGGFEEEEVQKALDLGIASLSLGKRILRCETAPLAALSIIMYETGNM